MEKIRGLAAATLDFVTEYAHTNGMNNTEIMNALAHIYVIYGFAVKLEGSSDEGLKTALVDCVVASVDHMIEVSADAEKA